PGTFANIASIGDAIGEYRERDAMGEILKSAVDPKTGTLDMNKAATAIALSGRDPVKYLTLLEAEARRKEAADFRGQSLDIARQGKDIQERQLKLHEENARRPTRQIVPSDPILGGGGAYTIPQDPDADITYRPFPSAVPPPAVAPQSALPGGGPDNLAAVEPSPENAPPYQVAG